ncbi:MAG TPA: hypothetical protein VLG40_03605 [Candidatus Saccharimonas sp.]|nr:hypothetical protein [Candidatus Saccharimonas sp.]
MDFTFKPKGPFDLLYQNQYFNGWPTLKSDPATVVMAFPIEDGWRGSAAVTLKQRSDGTLDVRVYAKTDHATAKNQALAAMSADEDATDWPKVGERDPFIKELQQKYNYMRPTKFHSPYEAAMGLLIGHRITVRQSRAIRAQMAETIGEKFEVAGESFYAFPTPQKLLQLKEWKGLNDIKIQRLHAAAQAALGGMLTSDYLHGLSEEEALNQLETLPGVGPFFSQGILYRGAGLSDGFTHDDLTYHAIKQAYNLGHDPTQQEVLAIAEKWRPFRMWVIVLMHVWVYETGNLPKRTFSKK